MGDANSVIEYCDHLSTAHGFDNLSLESLALSLKRACRIVDINDTGHRGGEIGRNRYGFDCHGRDVVVHFNPYLRAPDVLM
jgi:predicted nucleic acid-binding protein